PRAVRLSLARTAADSDSHDAWTPEEARRFAPSPSLRYGLRTSLLRNEPVQSELSRGSAGGGTHAGSQVLASLPDAPARGVDEPPGRFLRKRRLAESPSEVDHERSEIRRGDERAPRCPVRDHC